MRSMRLILLPVTALLLALLAISCAGGTRPMAGPAAPKQGWQAGQAARAPTARPTAPAAAPTPVPVAAPAPAAPSPFLLGMKFPVTAVGGYFPVFDRQLRGVHLADATGTQFILLVPTSTEQDRRLCLIQGGDKGTDEGLAYLTPGGPAEKSVLAALRDGLVRDGGAVRYAPTWSNGIDWDDPQKYAHPLRHAELERR